MNQATSRCKLWSLWRPCDNVKFSCFRSYNCSNFFAKSGPGPTPTPKPVSITTSKPAPLPKSFSNSDLLKISKDVEETDSGRLALRSNCSETI